MGASHGAKGALGDGDEEEKDKYRISPLEEVITYDHSTNIEVTVRLEEISKPGAIRILLYSKWSQDLHWHELGQTEINGDGSTSPTFATTFIIDFRMERLRLLRFEVYKIRDINEPDNLAIQKFLGSVDCSIVDIMMARAKDTYGGWLVADLMLPISRYGDAAPGKLCVFGEEDQSAKNCFAFTMTAQNIRSVDMFKTRPDPYFIVNRATFFDAVPEKGIGEELECKPIYRTEVARKTGKARFKRCELTAGQLCGSIVNNNQDIVVELHEWFRVSSDRYVGEAVFTLADLNRAFRESRPLVRPICVRGGKRKAVTRARRQIDYGKTTVRLACRHTAGNAPIFAATSTKTARDRKSGRGNTKLSSTLGSIATSRKMSKRSSVSSRSGGSPKSSKVVDRPTVFGPVVGDLIIEDIGVMRSYTFLDYLRGGLELKLAVAVDLTRSNKGPEDPSSKHHEDGDGADSAYSTAIRAIGDVLRAYDDDDRYSVYGFGAQIPPSRTVCSDCFALSGDFWDPEVHGIDGIIRAYQRALRICKLHGPTRIHEVIKLCAALAEPYAEAETPPINGVEMKFFVFSILTDGEVFEHDKIVDELAKAADLPMYVVILGIGDADFSFFRDLPQKVKQRRKEIKTPDASIAEQAHKMSRMMMQAQHRKGKGKREEGPRPMVQPRDGVNFVCYNDCRDQPWRLSSAMLLNLPKEVVSYYTGKSVAPRNMEKFEDDKGNSLQKAVPPVVKLEETLKPKATSSPSEAGRSNTKGSTGSASSKEGSSAPASRTVSKLGAEDRDRKAKLDSLPPFLKTEWDRVIKEAEKLGYPRPQIMYALREGVPAASLEVLVDCMLNGGYGKNPCYKDAALAAIPDPTGISTMLGKLPGQIEGMPNFFAAATDLDLPAEVTQKLQDGSPSRTSSRTRSQPPSRFQSRSPFAGTPNTSKIASGYSGSKESPLDQPSRPSKGILKAASKDFSNFSAASTWHAPPPPLTGKALTLPASRRFLDTTKESNVSMTSSGLRGAAAVRFVEQDQPDTSGGGQMCGVCLASAVATEFRPCQHRVACARCAAKLREESVTCPLCQGVVQEVVQL